jgi:hypothetical protein
MMPQIQETPGYHAGFYDAQLGEPLFDDATAEYRAGWRAYYEVRDGLEEVERRQG